MSLRNQEPFIVQLAAGWARSEDVAELRSNFDDLLQATRQSGVVPFIGAGLSAPFGFPAWTTLLLDLGRRDGAEEEIARLLAAGKYEEAAGHLHNRLGSTRFEDGLRHAYDDGRIPAGDLGGAVARLPELAPGPVITTNFDRVLETTFQRAGTPFGRILSGGGVAGSGAIQTSEQVLLKIHGDLADAEHRILTFEEYERHYGSAEGDLLDLDRGLPRLLHQILIHRSILFLGCSLRQDRTVTLLLEISRKYPEIYHYAVVEKPADEADFQAQRRHLSNHNIRPLWYPTGEHACVEAVLQRLVEEAPRAPKEPLGNLPPRPDLFVGRQREILEIRERLKERRLVTLLGPGGTGKTSLAIEVARASQEDFPDGVWCIELAPIEDPSLVPLTIAKALGLREQAPEPPTQVLADHLRRTRALIVLDNCEHLAAACRKVLKELLATCPELRFLATSRRGLRVAGQANWKVSPLNTPGQGSPVSAQDLLGFEAVQLFVGAAQDIDPGFQLQPDNLQPVATVLHRLEGIPLAIRLAASALRRYSVHQIAEQLSHHALDLLVSPDEVTVAHQQTLRRTLEWSYDILEAEMQSLLRGLSVFSGSFSREDVTAVCSVPECAENDLLERLLNHSMVEGFDRRHQRRYRLLEVVRQFARQNLQECGQEVTLLERHRQYFIAQAAAARRHLLGDQQAEWLERLEQSHANLRAVTSRALRAGDTSSALRLVACLWRFWEMRGYLSEGRSRLRKVLKVTANSAHGLDGADRSEALAAASLLAYRQGDLDEAESRIRQALTLCEQRGDIKGIANAWNDLGNIANQHGDLATADDAFRKSFAIKLDDPEIGTPRELGVAHFNLGNSDLYHGRLDEAQEHFDESLRLFEEIGNHWECGFPLNRMGMLALFRQDFDLAAQRFRQAYERRQGVDDKRGMGDAMDGLARTELSRRPPRLEDGRKHLRQALTLRREAGDQRGIVDTLEAVVCYLGLLRAKYSVATRLFAATVRLREGLATPTHPLFRPILERFRQGAVQSLGTEKFEDLMEQGRSISQAEALDLAEGLE